MADDKTLLTRAVDAAVGEKPEEWFANEQAPLPLDVPIDEAGKVKPPELRERTGKVGRPKGSRNRRQAEMADFILAQGGHPVLGMVKMYSMPLPELAKLLMETAAVLGIKDYTLDPLEVLKFQKDCMKEASPYLASKAPGNEDGRQGAMFQIVYVESDQAKRANGQGLQAKVISPPPDDDIEKNQ